MKKRIILTIFITISFFCTQAQKVNNLKYKEKDSINIIGKWIYSFYKDHNGNIIKLKNDEIQYLSLYKNKKYLKEENGSSVTGTWNFENFVPKLVFKNCEFKLVYNNNIKKIKSPDYEDIIEKINTDTMTFKISFLDSIIERDTNFIIRYFIRKK